MCLRAPLCTHSTVALYKLGENTFLLVWQPTGINFFSTVLLTLVMILLKQAHKPEIVLLVSVLIREQKYTIIQG